MKKSYHSLACQFHPDKNQNLNLTYLMQMIIEVKEKLGYTLRYNDAMGEE